MTQNYEETMRIAARKKSAGLEEIHRKRGSVHKRHEALESEVGYLSRIDNQVLEALDQLSLLADDEEWKKLARSHTQEFSYVRQETQQLVSSELDKLEEEKQELNNREDILLRDYEKTRAEAQIKSGSERPSTSIL